MATIVGSELLGPDLLNDKYLLDEIASNLSLFERPNGWHYDLDLIWILHSLENQKIYPGDTILDAGAGLGILQFILASRGYNVISLDYSDRKFSPFIRKLFSITELKTDLPKDDQYRNSVSYTTSNLLSDFSSKINLRLPYRLYRYLSRKIRTIKHRIRILSANPQSYGTITIVNASFEDIPQSITCDAVTCLSVIEHCPKEKINAYVQNLSKCLKHDSSPFLLTTSLNRSNSTTYNKYVRGIEFSTHDLESIFMSKINISDLNISQLAVDLAQDVVFRSRLPLCSYHPSLLQSKGSNSLYIPYVPIGILFTK